MTQKLTRKLGSQVNPLMHSMPFMGHNFSSDLAKKKVMHKHIQMSYDLTLLISSLAGKLNITVITEVKNKTRSDAKISDFSLQG